MAAKALIVAFVLFVLGLFCLLFGTLFGSAANTRIDDGIRDTRTIKPEAQSVSADYAKWVNPEVDTANSFIVKVFLYDCTNCNTFTKAGPNPAPKFQEKGPWVFKRYDIKYNISFSSDENQVSYSTWTKYVFQPDMSGSLTLDDKITSVNMAYFAGTYQAFPQSPTDPFTPFAVNVWAGMVSGFLGGVGQAMCTASGNALCDPRQMAATQWATLSGSPNSSLALIGNYSTATVGAGFPEPSRTTFLGALQALSATYTKVELDGYFSASEAANLLYGLGSSPVACPLFDVKNGCAAKFLGAYAAAAKTGSNLYLAYWNGLGFDITSNVSRVHLVAQYVGDATKLITTLTYGKAVNPQFPMFSTRTASQWILSYNDTFGAMLSPKLANLAYTRSYESQELAEASCRPNCQDTFLTGKDDSTPGQYVKYHGKTVLPSRATNPTDGTWCVYDEPVASFNLGQFPIGYADGYNWVPGVNESSELPSFASEISRKLVYKYASQSQVNSVASLRFKPDSNPDARYNQTRAHLVDLTCPNTFPLIISSVRFFNVTLQDYETPDVTLISSLTDPFGENFQNFIDVEPNSGITMRGARRLQGNLLIPATYFNATASSSQGKFYPLFWADLTKQALESDTSKLNSDFLSILSAPKNLMIALVVVGAVLVVASLALIVRGCKKE